MQHTCGAFFYNEHKQKCLYCKSILQKAPQYYESEYLMAGLFEN